MTNAVIKAPVPMKPHLHGLTSADIRRDGKKILRNKRSALEFIREIGGIDKGGRVKVTPL